jgi:molybdopterin converting factor small subunit
MESVSRSSSPVPDTRTGQVTLRYWAAARAAAGVETDVVEVDGPVTLAELVETSLRLHPHSDRLAQVLDCCSVLIGDRPAATEDRSTVRVEPGAQVEFLPPFAGG